MTTVLYNPLAGNGRGTENAKKIEKILDGEIEYEDITKIENLTDYIDSFPGEKKLVIAGGDGTLNRLANLYGGQEPKRELFYFPAGSGNDFMADIKSQDKNCPGCIRINEYLKDLPTVTVNGKTSYFVNGIGYGIDGYCCEEGDKLRASASKKKINYTNIALKGVFFYYHPTHATVTVDGAVKKYKHVWLAPTMNGRFYGGGMMVAPSQDRLCGEHTCSVVVAHSLSRIRLLLLFKDIFTGEHVKYTDVLDIITGHDIKVEFDRPTALQIDGETVVGVTSYSARKN